VQLLDRLILAWVLLAVRDGPAISGRLILPRSQAAIALARAPGRRGIDLVEIAQYRLDRGTEAVNVEPAKGGATLGRQALIVQPQPIDKRQYLLVAPHPCREALKGRARLGGGREVANIAVDARRIRPISLERHDVEAMLDDQMPRDRGAGTIEFRCAVRRLTEQHNPRIAKAIERRAELILAFRRRQNLAKAAQQPAQFGGFGFLLLQ